MDGLSLTIGGTLGAAIVSALVKIWTSRNTRAEIAPTPLPIKRERECISVGECNRKMCELEGRVQKSSASLGRL